jgi:hypothetical protein
VANNRGACTATDRDGDKAFACQRSSNNPHLWSLKIPHSS